MTRIAGAQLKTYDVNVEFRDRGSRKKQGGELVVVQFFGDAIHALDFSNLLRRAGYKSIRFVIVWTSI